MSRPTTSLDYYATLARAPHHDDDALTGGTWVNDRGVMRWVAREPEPEPTRFSVHGLIACPTCHARVDETCRTRNGHRTTPHGSRLAPRLCSCGSSIDWRRRMCDICRDRALQASKNTHGRRRREAA